MNSSKTVEEEMGEEERKRFDVVFEDVRLALSRTPPVTILRRSIQFLHRSYHKDMTTPPFYVPWIPLALIEWSLVFGPKPSILLPQEITDQGYVRLYNLLHDCGAGFEEKFLKSGDSFGVMKFFRCMAYQQFWFQGGKSSLRRYMGRNLLILKSFNDDFLKLSGLSVNEFYEFLFMTFAHFQNPKNGNAFTKGFFRDLRKKYTQHQIDLFFNLMSLRFDELQNFMREHHKYYEDNFGVQSLLSQMTPLWRYPFLNEGGNYVCFYPALIEYAIKHFVYDYLRRNLKASFSRPFGGVMESYVKGGLDYLGSSFFDEAQIQNVAKKYRAKKLGQIKCVDFLVAEKSGTVLIESKAHEMPAEVKINPENEVLAKYFPPDDRHLFHGIIQAYELCDFIEKNEPEELNSLHPDFYLVLVTYKDYYLGRGKDIWEEFVKDIVKPTLAKRGISGDFISPERIFILTLDEYDCLISQAKENNVGIVDLLNFAIERDKKPETMNYIFSGHLNAYNPKSHFYLPYLDDGFELVTNNLIEALK